jgi:hypothetical protein
MAKPSTFMRIEKSLLEEIKKRKNNKKESYAEVVRRVLRNDTLKQTGFEYCSFCGKRKTIGMPCQCKYGGVFG